MRFLPRPGSGDPHRRYDPNQPRVPAGNSDGGQWTSGGGSGDLVELVAAKRPRRRRGPGGPEHWPPEMRAIFEAYRRRELLYDLFGNPIGTVARTEINGEEVFGVNSDSPAYKSEDDRAARRLRAILIEKYPHVMQTEDIGRAPNDAVFHAETTALLRASRKNGGTLAGQALIVFVDQAICPSCLNVLPYVGLEIGNPTVTLVSAKGEPMTIRDGAWVKRAGKT